MNISAMHDEINFRDLGGIRTADGRQIREGLIYRSGGLYLMNDEEKAFFRSLNIRCILDLRTAEEEAAKPDPEFENITMLRHSGVVSTGGEQIDFSPAGMHRIGEEGIDQLHRLEGYYVAMPFHNEAFHVLVNAIKERNVPLVFHCATGKDRTGVAAMVVEALLGVDEEVILEDYLLSNVYFQRRIAECMEQEAQRIESHPEARQLLLMQKGVRPEIGEAVLAEMKKRCGSLDNYVRQEYSLSDHDVSQIRDYYLEQ